MIDLGPSGNDPIARAHERFVTGEPLEGAVRSPILWSWQRCQSLGLVPDRLELPYDEDLDMGSRLVRAAMPVLGQLESTVMDTRVSLILTDGQGRVLHRGVGDRSLTKQLDAVQLAPGFSYSERLAGTNAIGTALAERKPCLVLGPEHYAESLQTVACFTVPVRDPISGRIEGAVDLTWLHRDTHPAMQSFVRDAGAAIERRLLEESTERERALLHAYVRARRGAAHAGIVTIGEGPAGVEALADTVLGWHDREILREKATELLASGRLAALEVTLSTGHKATLFCRPVTTPSGVAGAAVEAILPLPLPRGAPTRPVAAPRAAGAVPIPRWPGVQEARRHPQRAVATGQEGAGSTDVGQLLLVGEPTVGKIAVKTRRRLQLMFEAGVNIGTTLDVSRTAQELADVAVPQLADFVTVDLLESVLRWEEQVDTSGPIRRMAVNGIRGDWPLYLADTVFRFVPSTPQARCLASGKSILEPDLTAAPGWLAQDPVRGEKLLLEHDVHSLITVPLRASGSILGLVTFYRSGKPDAFEEDDLSLAEELVAHAAVCIDNARRYTREHETAVALQRNLLPQDLPEQEAVEAAYRYMPAHAGVSGDWFDVIPLSGARVALVVGDVVGHGIQAAATMGRLRTAIHNFSDLDLPPDELLTHLDDLVGRLDGNVFAEGRDQGITGTTCLYAVYDPASGSCTMARAGHPLPAVATPDGNVTFPELPAGPPLGLGGLPFETAELHLPTGSRLVFYTDGLLADHRRDIDVGLERLRSALATPGSPAEETCRAVLDALLPARASDDVTLLVARTRKLDAGQVVSWDVPSDPAVVSTMRTAVTQQLADWDLEELGFATELILSELITNAIRYATSPIQVRMLRTNSLICEVSDGSSTSPHLRRAATTDEGGRGLFLVAQLVQRWGTRYTANGKVIWAEQGLSSLGWQ